MHGWEKKDFDPILFEYLMLLNCQIEKEHLIFVYRFRKYQFYLDVKLSYLYILSN